MVRTLKASYSGYFRKKNKTLQLPTPPAIHTRRDFLASTGKALGGLALWSAGLLSTRTFANTSPPAIPVGILHSLTGTMASSGRSLVDAIMMGVDEVNQQGGVLGKPLQPILEDGESRPETFAKKPRTSLKKIMFIQFWAAGRRPVEKLSFLWWNAKTISYGIPFNTKARNNPQPLCMEGPPPTNKFFPP